MNEKGSKQMRKKGSRLERKRADEKGSKPAGMSEFREARDVNDGKSTLWLATVCNRRIHFIDMNLFPMSEQANE